MVTTAARQDEVCELFLCEQTKLMLKPDTLYRFEVDENCPSCVKAAEPDRDRARAEWDRLRTDLQEAEAKVRAVEKHMAFRERLGSDSSPHYEIRAALSGGDAP